MVRLLARNSSTASSTYRKEKELKDYESTIKIAIGEMYHFCLRILVPRQHEARLHLKQGDRKARVKGQVTLVVRAQHGDLKILELFYCIL